MADKSTELERIYTIPLRRAHNGTRSKRADRAVRDVREYLQRHMKSEEIWIDGEVNELIWSHGKFRIPSRIRIRATRFEDGVVEVTLPESDTTGSVRAQIQERLEKAAETPVLVPAEEEAEETEHVHDDEAGKQPVTVLDGVGPATAEKLEKAGIKDIAGVVAAGAAAVAEATGHSEDVVKPWVDQAHELLHAHGDEEE
jgi:large subunit ribosomal protein L31e